MTDQIAPEKIAPAPAAAVAAQPQSSHRRHSFLVLTLGLMAFAAAGFYLYVPGLYVATTNDAYVDAHIVSVVPKIAAYVTDLHVNDNAKITAGDLLVELDPRDYQVAVDSAAADLASSKANVGNVETQLKEQQAVIAQNAATADGDRANLTFLQQELERYASLAHEGIGSNERYQQAQSDIGQKQAVLQHDLATLEASKTHVAVLETQRQQAEAMVSRAEAALAQAKLNLSYTKIYAAADGTVANKSVEEGNFVQPGQVLFSAVPDTLYITANYKETDLTNVRPSQPVNIRVDAFPNLRLKGHVDSIQRGTGAQFALLPPENATGNFVKIVQRVPVKIVFDDPGEALRWVSPGMSVETKITFNPPPDWLAWLR
ncbi:HlyD family secretion protein [Methylovirgula sp. 4M-Z18]|uniref:HlyD family secretion protein n=1 Tax=Methylovirgula sp. 4M-Z18 TaxID=2293567 RepID=UPI000E2EFEF1|nr:HlyD family secretion protein [Methylovirgula sp. 4M-Z18]RFB81124.1 HlyD family secretion protein [Methylovirgula sp. 4M-Z18]